MLGVDSYQGKPAPSDTLDILDLRWTSDERDFLDIDLTRNLAAVQEEDRASGFQHSMAYRVTDPLGSQFMSSAISQYFDCEFEPAHIWCGAGVASLLHDLAVAHSRWDHYVLSGVYPDYPVWIERLGGHYQSIPHEALGQVLSRPVDARLVLYLERPMLLEPSFETLEQIDDLCTNVSLRQGVVIIDESNANYWPPSFSAARLVRRHGNLIVLRGFSKAYGLGGLRCGIAVASRELRQRFTTLATPLQVSSISLHIAKSVLLLGDVTSGLRTQIVRRKDEMLSALRTAGLVGLRLSHGYLPYVFATDAQGPDARQLGHRGILGKPQPFWGLERGSEAPFRLSAPLRDDRFARLQHLLGRPCGPSA